MLDGDRDVGVAVEQLGDALVAFGIADDEVEAGVGLAEPGEGGSDEQADRGRERGDADLAGRAVRVQPHRVFGALDLGEDGVGVGEQQAAGRGDGDPAAAAFEQFLADLGLQGRQLLRDRRGRQVQHLGGRGHGAVISKRAQHSQASYLDHEPQLRTARRPASDTSASVGRGSAPAPAGGAGCGAGVGSATAAVRRGSGGGVARRRAGRPVRSGCAEWVCSWIDLIIENGT